MTIIKTQAWARLALICCAALLAGAPSATAGEPQQAVAPQAARVQQVRVTAGRSVVLQADFDVRRLAVTNPAVADATVVEAREILIDAKAPGTISLILWGATERTQYDLVVEPPVSPLQQQLQALFPGENINVGFNDEAIVLSGNVSSNQVSLRAGEIAQAVSSKLKVVNLLQLPGGSESQQVLLQVRFAEVNRQAMTELGASWFTGPTGIGNTLGRISTGQFAAPGFSNIQYTKANGDPGSSVTSASGQFSFSDFLNLFLFSEKFDIGAVVQLLKTKGYLQSLAEPNLIAYNGQEASFLAGGEFPIPIVQGLANTVTIQFKEFGVRLNFKPTIAGDTIRLKVRPEVSSLDFANGITLSGFRIPALITRRAETDVELRDGQSFAIAGLLNNISQDDTQTIPVLGSLPIIGALFKSKAETAQRTELMVLITPRLVRALNPDEVPRLPNNMKRFLPAADGLGQELSGGGGAVDAPAPPKTTGKSKNQ